MKKKPSIFTLFVAVLALCICAVGCSNQDEIRQYENPPTILNNLNHFTAQTLDGGTFTENNFADKDVTVVYFWSLMPDPDTAEMTNLAAFNQSLPNNVQLITVCRECSSAPEKAKAILNQAGFTGTTIIAGDEDFALLNANITTTPTAILVDNAGNLVSSSIVGSQENLAETYTAYINKALKSLKKEEISPEPQ